MDARLHHVGIAVHRLADAIGRWAVVLGIDPDLVETETVEEEGVRIAFIDAGSARIELLEPLEPEQGPVGRFLARRGEGVHHLAFEVTDVEAAAARLREAGLQLLDETPRVRGGNRAIVFVHPRSTSGVLTELVAYREPGEHGQPA